MKIILLLFLCSSSFANSFYSSVDIKIIAGNLANQNLKDELHYISAKNQVQNEYREARWFLYTDVYLQQDENGRYFIEDIYCEKRTFSNAGPDSMPRGSKTNIEHSWPQSKFSPEFSKPLQKGDLHHLFIANSSANHLRGHYNFGEIEEYFSSRGKCKNAGLGLLVNTPQDVIRSSNEHYQPPKKHRGKIARALFYFATRYHKKINDTQEYFLRKWHKENPVSEIDRERNDRIMKLQGNRNPFIDYPNLVNRIKNF
jgi:deoxyribonuclease-1